MKKTCETKEKLLQVGFDLIWDMSYGSVSVDDICKRAGINKGSFYHFFPSKADLVVEAYEASWREYRPQLDSIFSAHVPPLERFHKLCQHIYDVQKEMAEKYGHVCGCPYANVGCEVANLDEKIRAKSEQLMDTKRKYIESTIADAMREGLVSVKDPKSAALTVQSLILGKLVEARVQNDLKVFDGLEATILGFLGTKQEVNA
jgi:TetR/AcrR family transcriptional repressor of nem operon